MHIQKINTKKDRRKILEHNLRIGEQANHQNVIKERTKNNVVLVDENDSLKETFEAWKNDKIEFEKNNPKNFKKDGSLKKVGEKRISEAQDFEFSTYLKNNQTNKNRKSLIFHYPIRLNGDVGTKISNNYFERVVSDFKSKNILIDSATIHNDENGLPHLHIVTPMKSIQEGTKRHISGENSTFSILSTGEKKNDIKSAISLNEYEETKKKKELDWLKEQHNDEKVKNYMEEVKEKKTNPERKKATHSYNEKDYKIMQEMRKKQLNLKKEKELLEYEKDLFEQEKEHIKKREAFLDNTRFFNVDELHKLLTDYGFNIEKEEVREMVEAEEKKQAPKGLKPKIEIIKRPISTEKREKEKEKGR